MPLTDAIIAAGTSLNELHEIEWRSRMFARQHMHSSERELRAEINRIAHASRMHHVDRTLDRRQEKIAGALIKMAQSLIAAKHAPPIPAKFNSRGELKLEFELRAEPPSPSHSNKHSVPHARTKAEQDALEHQVAEERRLAQAQHEREVQERAKALAEDDETFYLHVTRWRAVSEEKKLQDELARAEMPNAAPLDEDKIVALMASMLNYSQEAEMMRLRLNAKYKINIPGEGFEVTNFASDANAQDDSKAWDDIDAVSPRGTAMATAGAACAAIAKQRLGRLKAHLALRQPLGRSDSEKEKKALASVLAAQQAAGLFGGDDETVIALLPPIVTREMAQILRDLRTTEAVVWNLKRKIIQDEREKQNQQTIIELKKRLKTKLEEILALRVKYRDNNNQLESVGGKALDGQQLDDRLKGDTAPAGSAPEIENEIKGFPSSSIR